MKWNCKKITLCARCYQRDIAREKERDREPVAIILPSNTSYTAHRHTDTHTHILPNPVASHNISANASVSESESEHEIFMKKKKREKNLLKNISILMEHNNEATGCVTTVTAKALGASVCITKHVLLNRWLMAIYWFRRLSIVVDWVSLTAIKASNNPINAIWRDVMWCVSAGLLSK